MLDARLEGCDFYSRPYARGDLTMGNYSNSAERFLLTPLREGRQSKYGREYGTIVISTHAPTRGATCLTAVMRKNLNTFLLTPLREGRRE